MRSLTRVLLFQCVCFFKVERRIDLVYGGGSVGLMGLVSQAVHDGGRHVLGFALSLPPSREVSKDKHHFIPYFSFLSGSIKWVFIFFFFLLKPCTSFQFSKNSVLIPLKGRHHGIKCRVLVKRGFVHFFFLLLLPGKYAFLEDLSICF